MSIFYCAAHERFEDSDDVGYVVFQGKEYCSESAPARPGAVTEAQIRWLVNTATVALQYMAEGITACHGYKCREPNCESCFGDAAEEAVKSAIEASHALRAAIAAVTAALAAPVAPVAREDELRKAFVAGAMFKVQNPSASADKIVKASRAHAAARTTPTPPPAAASPEPGAVAKSNVVTWYDSAAAVHEEYMRHLAEACGESLDGAVIGGVDADGNEVELSAAQVIEGMQAQRLWGFCDGKRIHAWATRDVEETRVIGFLAHELAHLRGADAPPIAAQEEAWAELVRGIAEEAVTLAGQRPDTAAPRATQAEPGAVAWEFTLQLKSGNTETVIVTKPVDVAHYRDMKHMIRERALVYAAAPRAGATAGGVTDTVLIDWMQEQVNCMGVVWVLPCGDDMRFVQVRSFGDVENFPTVKGTVRDALAAARRASDGVGGDK